jgi:GT2 family glycosyltransferase
MDISIIIPVYNAYDDVKICLESLDHSLVPDGTACELLFVNDGSSQATSELLQNFCHTHAYARIIENTKNIGYLLSANKGVSVSTGAVTVLLNSDTAVPQGFTDRIWDCFASNSSIGVASPVGSSGGPFCVPMKPGLAGRDVDVMDGYLRSHHPQYPTLIFPDGFCFCVRRAVWEQIGLFDEQYSPGYAEETDLAMRAWIGGWRTVFIDNLYVYHKSKASFGSSASRRLIHHNQILFNKKWKDQYSELQTLYPDKKLRSYIYPRVYSLAERIWRKTVRFCAQFIPIASVRRNVRYRYS